MWQCCQQEQRSKHLDVSAKVWCYPRIQFNNFNEIVENFPVDCVTTDCCRCR